MPVLFCGSCATPPQQEVPYTRTAIGPVSIGVFLLRDLGALGLFKPPAGPSAPPSRARWRAVAAVRAGFEFEKA